MRPRYFVSVTFWIGSFFTVRERLWLDGSALIENRTAIVFFTFSARWLDSSQHAILLRALLSVLLISATFLSWVRRTVSSAYICVVMVRTTGGLGGSQTPRNRHETPRKHDLVNVGGSLKKYWQNHLSDIWVASSFNTVRAVWNNYPALARHFKMASEDPSRNDTERKKFPPRQSSVRCVLLSHRIAPPPVSRRSGACYSRIASPPPPRQSSVRCVLLSHRIAPPPPVSRRSGACYSRIASPPPPSVVGPAASPPPPPPPGGRRSCAPVDLYV